MEASSIGRTSRDKRDATAQVLSDTEEETEDEELGSEEESERVDYFQLFAAAISTLREEEEGERSDCDDASEGEEESGKRTRKRQRLSVVSPLDAAYAHFERQEADLRQAAALGQMLLEKNKQLEEQLDLYQNSPILNEYQDKIRLQQEKIWELQSQEESVRTELEELKVELKVKKRMLNSKTRLAEQLEAKLWDYIQKIEKEKENRDNEENKKTKREMEQREKMRRLSDEVENHKEELKEARSESERLRKQVANLLDKLGSFRSELTRERAQRTNKSRSNSFSRRLTSFFSAPKSENENESESESRGGGSVGVTPSGSFADLDEYADDDNNVDELLRSFGNESEEDSGGSAPGSRRQSARGRQQFFQQQQQHAGQVLGGVDSIDDKRRDLKQENEGLRRELAELAEDHSRLRDSVNAMRDHERKAEKERKRERKLLAQAQQTIEELKLRIIDAQLLSSSASSSSSSVSTTLSESPVATPRLPLSYSLPSTPHVAGSHAHVSTAAGPGHSTPLPPTSFTPQPAPPGHFSHSHPLLHSSSPFQQHSQHSVPYVQQSASAPSSPQALFAELQQQQEMERSVRDELAAIDDILLGDDDDDELLLTTPRVAAPASPAAARMPASPRPAVEGGEKDKRVWVVAEGQRGRSGSDNAEERREKREEEKEKEKENGQGSKRENDGRLFIFAEELERKVVQKFVYDEEELKEGLQEEVEACVADFLAKREQELQGMQPAVLKARRKRALSRERDDLLLFFGVFLTSSPTAAAAADDVSLLSTSAVKVGSEEGEIGDDEDEGEDDEDGWQILDKWRAGRGSDPSGPGGGKVAEVSTTSTSGTRSRLGSASGVGGKVGGGNAGHSGAGGVGEGKSLAAVQTWVKHIPFDFGKRQTPTEVASTSSPSSSSSSSSVSTDADADELARIEAAISGEPLAPTPTAPTVALTTNAKQPADDEQDEGVGMSEQEHLRDRIRAELARLNLQLAVRRREVADALRPIVAIVPSTAVYGAVRRHQRRLLSPQHNDQRRSFSFLDLVLYD